MFAYIKGSIEYINQDSVIIDHNGIGFKVMTSIQTINKVNLHNIVTIYTHMNVREDDISLYGFLTKEELDIFRLLIGISGIGPKGALAILSTLSVDELRIAVLSEDYKAIAKANGVGTKTAQRLVIELKDKLKLEDVLFGFEDDNSASNVNPDNISEASMALVSLGYTNSEALKAIKKVSGYDTMSVEVLIKAALKKMI